MALDLLAISEMGDIPLHLRTRGVTQVLGGVRALDGVSLEVARGELVFLIGGSGAGKTTLLRILAGLDRPVEGQVWLGDRELTALCEGDLFRVRRGVGVVFQDAALFDDMTVAENLALPLEEHRLARPEQIEEAVRMRLADVELEGTEGRVPAELSGGMRKRVGLARALMLDPEVVLYDEPTGGLDPVTSHKVEEIVWRTCRRGGVTSVAVSHDMASALRIADHILVLNAGRLATAGTPVELVHGRHPLVQAFLQASGVSVERILDERPGVASR